MKSEEEEAKVHFCDDVAAIKRRRASELAAVCGGGGGAAGVKSLYRSRAVERDTIDCEHRLRTAREEIAFIALHGQKFIPTPKVLGKAEAYFVCHIGQTFQISLIYAFIGCP